MEIECVPNYQCNLKLPSTPEDYNLTAKLALISQGSYWNDEGKPGDHNYVMQHYHIHLNSVPVLPASVHCECAFISYLVEDIFPPQFSYVGTSELSCLSCWKFLDIKYGEHTMKAIGHGSIQRPWGHFFRTRPRKFKILFI